MTCYHKSCHNLTVHWLRYSLWIFSPFPLVTPSFKVKTDYLLKIPLPNFAPGVKVILAVPLKSTCEAALNPKGTSGTLGFCWTNGSAGRREWRFLVSTNIAVAIWSAFQGNRSHVHIAASISLVCPVAWNSPLHLCIGYGSGRKVFGMLKNNACSSYMKELSLNLKECIVKNQNSRIFFTIHSFKFKLSSFM